MAERVAIVGARDVSPETLDKVRELVESLPHGTIVVSGGANGVDSEAAKHARIPVMCIADRFRSSRVHVTLGGAAFLARGYGFRIAMCDDLRELARLAHAGDEACLST